MDTSAFVKLFLTEAGSLAMTEFALAEPDENKIICALAAVEARSALVKLGRMGRLEQDQIRLALSILSDELLRLTVQAITPLVISKASELVERHELRALDALQLGAAIQFRDSHKPRSVRFIASDIELLAAAVAEGFTIWDPVQP